MSDQTLKATIAEAQADTPVGNPAFYTIAFYNAAQQPGSGSIYKLVTVQPTHQGKFQNGNGAWYEFAGDCLRPEQFGQIGVNAAGDTTAWKALVSVANARGGSLHIEMPSQTYRLNGTGVEVDDQTFTNFQSIELSGMGGTEVRQMGRLSKTFKFVRQGGKLKVSGLTAIGYAQTQIDAGLTPDEINFNSSSGNAVAAIYAKNIEEVDVRNVATRNHAGRDIHCFGVTYLKCRDLDLVGLGPKYNRPIQDGHQGNGEDAAIYHIPSDYSANGTAWKQTLEIQDSRIRWHSICVRTILNKAIVLHGNYFGETPGQHHIYDSDSDGHDIVGNVFDGCRQLGYKMQFENRAGTEIGELYDPNKPSYKVGDIARRYSILWICTSEYSPGGADLSTQYWKVHPRFRRTSGVWSGNVFRDCGGGIGIIAASLVYPYNIWSEGYVLSGNSFENCAIGLYLHRCWKATVVGNNIQNADYGILGGDFCGSISNNDIWTSKRQGIVLSISKTTTLENNRFWNCALSGGGLDEKTPVLLSAPDGNSPPENAANPQVFFRNNGFFFQTIGDVSASDAAGDYLAWGSDPRLRWDIEGTYGTPTNKKFRIDGAIGYQFRNHFTQYYNTAQNDPLFTLASWSTQYTITGTGAPNIGHSVATLASILGGKRVIKTTG